MFDIIWRDVRSLVQAMERQASRALGKWDVGETGSGSSLRSRIPREAIVCSSSRSSSSLHLTDLYVQGIKQVHAQMDETHPFSLHLALDPAEGVLGP